MFVEINNNLVVSAYFITAESMIKLLIRHLPFNSSAFNVFIINDAIVIGPTPPGTGEI
jgi:hypothetical protein